MQAQVAQLTARIEELERQAKGKTPQNSSLPPSTQHPHNRPQPPRRKSKRKRGGQPGHEKHERPLIPTEKCDEAVPLKPSEYWRVERLQWCWAHLKRDFQAMIDSGDRRAKWLGERLRAASCELFEHWADYRAGKISRAALVRRMTRGTPEIFNTDQGVQYTATAFTERLESAGVAISMDGRGRWMDNVFVERLWRTLKYEHIYRHDYGTPRALEAGLARFFLFYNDERLHAALDYLTPAAMYAAA